FSFQKDEPLDMRMDKSQDLTAEVIINQYSKDVLRLLLVEEGNVRQPDRLVENILKIRDNTPIKTTFQLIDIIKKSIFVRSRSQLIAELTKVFQAIRVAVNDEMGELNSFLENVLQLKGVVVAIITFQPNEDRKVKQFVKQHKLEAITKKPLQSTYHERKKNPREKTAKLRIFKV
ncbi:MAG: 16S rRNA (cytosine(1402)-N(4))-methyltransferase, partial [Candidatus Margulisiibacteriota bacterium]|nr:16S rRNA (cytosine(1402)-N(4))-methyltransferase [Candidatus Margulisiibacteriota bacterium]